MNPRVVAATTRVSTKLAHLAKLKPHHRPTEGLPHCTRNRYAKLFKVYGRNGIYCTNGGLPGVHSPKSYINDGLHKVDSVETDAG